MVFRVFFDANVLVPITVTDLLLRCANRGFYTPYWSEKVLQEVDAALKRLHPPLEPPAIEKRLNAMRAQTDGNICCPHLQICQI